MLTENVYINNRLEPTATTTTKLTHLRTFMVYYILRSIEFIAIQTIYLEERYRLTPYFPFFGSTSAVNCSRCVLSLSLFFTLSHVLALSLSQLKLSLSCRLFSHFCSFTLFIYLLISRLPFSILPIAT